ncbi:unannotated protein [freshwater metagenome]|uniref:Unannotated protein n=1 Tax=freshwater metagenome TaxID=449393 RepID=A0A6J6KG28_9ZZZZ
MSADKPQKIVSDMRNVRYGEVLGVFVRDTELYAEVWGTQMLHDCPMEWWNSLDPETLKTDLGALGIKMNGPRHWVLDGFGNKTAHIEPVIRDFNGLPMRRIATVEFKPGDKPVTSPYEERHVNRGAVFFWDAGTEVYELVRPDGEAYVMQALCNAVDESLSIDNLAELGSKLQLPQGWSYRTRILEEDLVVDTSDHFATVVQDEKENTYTLPY